MKSVVIRIQRFSRKNYVNRPGCRFRMASFRFEDGNLIGSDEDIRIRLDSDTGSIESITNRITGHKLLPSSKDPPWRMTPVGASTERLIVNEFPPGFEEQVPSPSTVGMDISPDNQSALLSWDTTWPEVGVEVMIRFGDTGELEFWPEILVGDDVRPPLSFSYPILYEPNSLSPNGEADRLVFPLHSGWLIRKPLQHDPIIGSYPNGIGCSMQFTAYFEKGTGGFYFATHDPHSTWKELTFGSHEWSFRHETWDLRRGTSLTYDYPVVLSVLTEGDWYESANVYRSWALNNAPWTSSDDEDGAVSREKRSWLHEDVGLALWGTPSSLDWSRFYEFYENVTDTPLHICSGWDWPARRPHALGKEGWFPADFHQENLDAWEDHYVTPYANDLFISSRADDFLTKWEPSLTFPYSEFSFTSFSKPHPDWIDGEMPDPDPAITTDINFFLCPSTEPQRDLHAWRASKLVNDYPLEGACYDISSGIPYFTSRCWRTDHGHPPGRGRELIEALDDLNKNSRAVTEQRTGQYLVQGVETIVESIIDSVDFHVSRGAGGPLGVLEAWQPAPEEPPGTGRELLPLFEAVYHDIGPVRHDGWLSLNHIGDLWFWIAARIVIKWGSLFSLEYALNPPERPPDYEGGAASVDWGGAKLQWDTLPKPDPEKVDFIRELAKARTELATSYLGHGRLLRPVDVDIEPVKLDFEQRALWQQLPGIENKGTWKVPAVVQGAWEDPEGSVGLLFAVVANDSQDIVINANCKDLWDLDLAESSVTCSCLESTREVGSIGKDNVLRLDVELPPRKVYLIEIQQ